MSDTVSVPIVSLSRERQDRRSSIGTVDRILSGNAALGAEAARRMAERQAPGIAERQRLDALRALIPENLKNGFLGIFYKTINDPINLIDFCEITLRIDYEHPRESFLFTAKASLPISSTREIQQFSQEVYISKSVLEAKNYRQVEKKIRAMATTIKSGILKAAIQHLTGHTIRYEAELDFGREHQELNSVPDPNDDRDVPRATRHNRDFGNILREPLRRIYEESIGSLPASMPDSLFREAHSQSPQSASTSRGSLASSAMVEIQRQRMEMRAAELGMHLSTDAALSITPDTILVPPSLEEVATRIFNDNAEDDHID